MYILETKFEHREQNVYFIDKIPTALDDGYNKYATRINCFFHRSAKDGIHYNVTNFRQFTRHDDFELDMFTHAEKITGKKLINETTHCDTLDDFFALVGFNYKTKTWPRVGEVCRKWNGTKYV